MSKGSEWGPLPCRHKERKTKLIGHDLFGNVIQMRVCLGCGAEWTSITQAADASATDNNTKPPDPSS